MAEIIRMPRLSDTMEEGVIVSWLINEGDKVSPGDILAEVETDKATMELESFYEGYLLHIGVKEGAVPVDEVIAVIGGKDEDYKAILAADPLAGAADSKVASTSNGTSMSTHQESDTKQEQSSNQGAEVPDTRVKASPLAKSMANEAGIDLSLVQGSGDQGRVIKKDIESYRRKAPDSSPAQTGMTHLLKSGYIDQPVSQMRKTIARRLSESKFTIPHFYLTIEINMDRAYQARKTINDKGEGKISFNDIIVKGCALALKKHPAVNSSWLGDKIRTHYDVNIGVAVAVNDGLLVPVINHADQKSLRAINAEVREKATKAKDKKLGLDEMQGNTFTISNLGMFGIEEFTAIVNPPDACILAVGGIQEKAIVINGQISVGKIMKVTLSCDHRVVDGATGSKFLQTFKDYLEEPLSMLV